MTEHDDTTSDPSPWTRPRFVAAALVVALIAVLAVVLAVTRTGADSDTAAPPTADPAAAASPTTTTAVGAESVCGIEPGEQTVPVTAPEDTRWELVGTVAAPTAPTVGPGVVQDGLRSCFTRSPLGALYAAVNVLAATTVPGQGEALVSELAAAGAGRDTALVKLVEDQNSPSSARIQVAGFTFLNYDQDATTIDLAIRGENGAHAHLPMTMRWEKGDWKVVFPPDGDLASLVGPLPDLTGYVPWGGA